MTHRLDVLSILPIAVACATCAVMPVTHVQTQAAAAPAKAASAASSQADGLGDGIRAYGTDVAAYRSDVTDRLTEASAGADGIASAERSAADEADDISGRIDERDARLRREAAERDAASAERAQEERAADEARAQAAADAARDSATAPRATQDDDASDTTPAVAATSRSRARQATPAAHADTGDAPASDSWVSDAGYCDAQVARAERRGSDTDWLIACDTDLCRMSVMHRTGGSWEFYRGWNCDVGRVEGGRSISLNWPDGTIVAKYTNAGAGDNVNPWMSSVSGAQNGFGIHGGWGHLSDYEAGGGGPKWTPGGIVCENGPSKWVYDTCPVGTRVVVF